MAELDIEKLKSCTAIKQIPILTLDERWYHLITDKLKTDEICYWEKQVNELLKKQGQVNNDIKEVKRIKRPFTGEQMESMRSHCDQERDLALLEVLYSTAIRVGEVVKLNRSDIDFSDTGIIVFGKGNKERETYLNSKAFYHLKEYLKIRTDDNEALFVSSRKPYQRLTKAGIQNIFRNIGKKSGVEKVHPHRFRRTAATDLLRAGMPLEEVKEYLGHEKIDTTMIYCTVNQDNIKNSHQRYMSA